MRPEIFATDALGAQDQYEAWRAWFMPLLEVVPGAAPAQGFAAENRVWKLDGMAISQVSAPAVRVVRTRANMRSNPSDHWVLSYCRRGSTMITTDRRTLDAPAGVPFVWSLGEASRSERTAVERMQIFLPRDTFRELAPLLDQACGAALDTPFGRLLGDFMLSLERRLPDVTAADAPRLIIAVRGMVAACLDPSDARLAEASGQIAFGRLERVRQAVRRHLRSPRLGPAVLCQLVGVSRSNLYRLFEDTGGVAHYIQTQRLLAAHAALSDAENKQPVAAIAEEFCFADASSFSRAFRKEFGYSPSDVRGAGLAGMALPARPRTGAGPAPGQFRDLLRRL
jgi:AraC-like DNA-binding protein